MIKINNLPLGSKNPLLKQQRQWQRLCPLRIRGEGRRNRWFSRSQSVSHIVSANPRSTMMSIKGTHQPPHIPWGRVENVKKHHHKPVSPVLLNHIKQTGYAQEHCVVSCSPLFLNSNKSLIQMKEAVLSHNVVLITNQLLII